MDPDITRKIAELRANLKQLDNEMENLRQARVELEAELRILTNVYPETKIIRSKKILNLGTVYYWE